MLQSPCTAIFYCYLLLKSKDQIHSSKLEFPKNLLFMVPCNFKLQLFDTGNRKQIRMKVKIIHCIQVYIIISSKYNISHLDLYREINPEGKLKNDKNKTKNGRKKNHGICHISTASDVKVIFRGVFHAGGVRHSLLR